MYLGYIIRLDWKIALRNRSEIIPERQLSRNRDEQNDDSLNETNVRAEYGQHSMRERGPKRDTLLD